MESWDSKIPFSNFSELGDSQLMYGKLRLYLMELCACNMDKFVVTSLSVLQNN